MRKMETADVLHSDRIIAYLFKYSLPLMLFVQ